MINTITVTAGNEAVSIENGEAVAFPEHAVILDGQHRVQALHIVQESMMQDSSENGAARLQSFLQQHIPFLFIDNRGPQDTGQMFSDLNNQRPVSRTERAYLDNRNPSMNVVKETLSQMQWVTDRTDKSRTNPERDGQDIFTLGILLSLLRVQTADLRKPITKAHRENMAQPSGKNTAAQNLQEALEWMADARKEIKDAQDPKFIGVATNRTASYAYDPKLMAFLVHLENICQNRGKDTQELAQFISTLNLTKADPGNDLLKTYRLIDDRGRMLPLKDATYDEACNQILARIPDRQEEE